MDTTAHHLGQFIAMTEDALEGFSDSTLFRLELTITPFPAWQSTQRRMRSFKPGFVTREELLSTLQNLRASSAPTSSSTQE